MLNAAASDINLVVYIQSRGVPLVLGKGGVDNDSKQINLVLMDPATNKSAQIINDTNIGTISGIYADKFVPATESLAAEESYYILKSGTKLIAKPKNTAGIVKVEINGKTAYYKSLDEAIKDINSVGKATDEIVIVCTQAMFSAPIAKLPLPNAGKYGKLTYCGASLGNQVNINVTSDINLTGDLVLDGVIINKVDRNEDILPISVNLGKYTLEMKVYLSRLGGAYRIANINGTGKFITNSDTIVTGRVNVGTFGFNNNTVTLEGTAAAFTGSVSVDTKGTLAYDKTNAKNVKFNNVSGDPLTVKVADVAAGDTIAAITGDYTKGAIKIDGSDLLVVRSGGYLKAFNASDVITVKELEYFNELISLVKAERVYDTLENAMTDISRLNDKNMVYKVFVKDGYFTSLPLPKANTYNTVVLIGSGTEKKLTVGRDITLTGNMYIEDLTINKVNTSGAVLPMNMNVGNYHLTVMRGSHISYDEVNMFTNINGTKNGGILFADGKISVSGSINIGTLQFSDTLTLGSISSLTVSNIVADSNAALSYPRTNAARIKLGTIGGSLTIKIDGVAAGTQIATLTGDYIAGSVVINDGSEFTTVRSGTKLIAFGNRKGVIVSDGTNNRVYDTYANAIADITRLNNKNGEYKIFLPAGKYTWTSLTFPARGKYASIEIAASGAADIEVRSDATLTGNVVIGTNVTLKKVKIFGGDPVAPFNFTSVKNRDGSPVYTVKTNGGTIVNGKLNGEAIQETS